MLLSFVTWWSFDRSNKFGARGEDIYDIDTSAGTNWILMIVGITIRSEELLECNPNDLIVMIVQTSFPIKCILVNIVTILYSNNVHKTISSWSSRKQLNDSMSLWSIQAQTLFGTGINKTTTYWVYINQNDRQGGSTWEKIQKCKECFLFLISTFHC